MQTLMKWSRNLTTKTSINNIHVLMTPSLENKQFHIKAYLIDRERLGVGTVHHRIIQESCGHLLPLRLCPRGFAN